MMMNEIHIIYIIEVLQHEDEELFILYLVYEDHMLYQDNEHFM